MTTLPHMPVSIPDPGVWEQVAHPVPTVLIDDDTRSESGRWIDTPAGRVVEVHLHRGHAHVGTIVLTEGQVRGLREHLEDEEHELAGAALERGRGA